MAQTAAARVDRNEIRVMFLRTKDEVPEIRRVWERLEEVVGTRGRKFFGSFDEANGEYRACVQRQDGDEPEALGLEEGTLPGGRYLRTRLRGEPPALYERIGPTFRALARSATPDPTRPSIEFYRRRDEIDLLLPVVDR